MKWIFTLLMLWKSKAQFIHLSCKDYDPWLSLKTSKGIKEQKYHMQVSQNTEDTFWRKLFNIQFVLSPNKRKLSQGFSMNQSQDFNMIILTLKYQNPCQN